MTRYPPPPPPWCHPHARLHRSVERPVPHTVTLHFHTCRTTPTHSQSLFLPSLALPWHTGALVDTSLESDGPAWLIPLSHFASLAPLEQLRLLLKSSTPENAGRDVVERWVLGAACNICELALNSSGWDGGWVLGRTGRARLHRRDKLWLRCFGTVSRDCGQIPALMLSHCFAHVASTVQAVLII